VGAKCAEPEESEPEEEIDNSEALFVVTDIMICINLKKHDIYHK
jgi:hypothetical protein